MKQPSDDKKSIFKYAKLRHYNTVNPSRTFMYAPETLGFNRKNWFRLKPEKKKKDCWENIGPNKH